MKTVASQKYWEQHWNDTIYKKVAYNHPVAQWINNNILSCNGLECFEIGCYPGKFLALLGDKGYIVNGIDTFKEIDTMGLWLKSSSYKTKDLQKGDFLKYKSTKKYDLVCSFGFVEHFDNWQQVVTKHLNLTKSNGTCLIEVPNLGSPIYYFLYKILEPNVLKNHNLEAMSLNKMKQFVNTTNHKIIKAEYISKFYFRFITKNGGKYKLIENIINFFGKLLNILPKRLSSRHIGYIIR